MDFKPVRVSIDFSTLDVSFVRSSEMLLQIVELVLKSEHGSVPLDKRVVADPVGDVEVAMVGLFEDRLSPFICRGVDVFWRVIVGANVLDSNLRCP